MFVNENVSITKFEIFLKKLTKIHDDLVRLENWKKKKKLNYLKLSFFEKLYERFGKLFLLFITLFIIIYCYYFYVFVIYKYFNISGI